jgi:hypothetical protein
MTQSIVWYTCLTVDFFYSLIQEYSLALWQCYDRYLLHFGNINVEEITDVDSFRLTFFPEGFDSENAGLTVSLQNITSPHDNHRVLRSKTSKNFWTSKFFSFSLELYKNKLKNLIQTSKLKFSFRGLHNWIYGNAVTIFIMLIRCARYHIWKRQTSFLLWTWFHLVCLDKFSSL